MHRIPTYKNHSKVKKQETVPLLSKQNVYNIPAPGLTGIPQVDQIHSSVASKQFPSPNQFAVTNISTGTTFYQPSNSNSYQQSSVNTNQNNLTSISNYQTSGSLSVNGISAPISSSSTINLPPITPVISSSNTTLSTVLTSKCDSLTNEVI